MSQPSHHKFVTASIAIVCIAALDALAIWKGIDGVVMAASITAISTIVGFVFGKKISPFKRE
jgi:hypothetical protein